MSNTIANHLLRSGVGLHRGSVCEQEEDGRPRVLVNQVEVVCDMLEPVSGILPGDNVLVWLGEGVDRGIVIGRIAVASADPAPESVVLEARENLTLRCGEGSITIRKDGRILIRGKDLVSHAKRANRIRGGSVAIN